MENHMKSNNWLSEDEVIGDTLMFMIAECETTSTALAYATYVLAKHPNILKKLRNEIDEFFLNNDMNDMNDEKIKEYLDYDIIVQLSYMNMFILEVLRMFPIANITIQRRVMENTIVQGINIEKGEHLESNRNINEQAVIAP
ncbi:unnamed protein product [Adineta steineri]|uniref:Cytochrome P450 n=1 Tax=Adineta steineri TaxID=433720 RepID=A0A815KN08_9BILA|nr:unnamed protein product [Adineta steineri]CAF1612422.1 unnamed protein product [Adineta steineri]